ncbi:shikimate dehydrogenase [Sulfurimonas denitrificans DSM 1251]|uniref:Shikimate dehydrogenase (NADP(+)) n=1 Tax=Sulfurimonas denitrificans (strain ATCC 33889 / DSM 1251) TaxID=326298 RepID=Q30R25_SULDN|nr:shikimate dehydrogenase [Sulfurimonas denitrificans]ABB44556.1 shikimate dehydrogenase [Sulfurimonas denitrificans DSM 1251]MDD3441740.1 shikimate dehydrogenase [Sulfurimonas denitrificans]
MKLFAIFGDPVAHSRSPLMHNSVFKNLNYKACYTRIHLQDGSKLKETFLSLKLSGANITVPHKEAAYAACDEVRGFAKKVGVVNTIVNENGRLIGYNTDADGFMFAIKEFGDVKNILILGAGGTAKALASKFIDSGIKVSVMNRSDSRLSYFKELGCECFNWDNFEIKKYDLVLNSTSAGLKDKEFPAPLALIEQILNNTSFVAEVIYGKITPFLKLAKEKNITCKDGADMLLAQGILANELFVNSELKSDDIEHYMSKSFTL